MDEKRLAKRSVSHAVIVASRDAEIRDKAVLDLAKAAVCVRQDGSACGVCRHCTLAGRGVHPDIIFIDRPLDDKGKMKREISVAQIRRMAADAFVLPQEAERKVYVIREANKMNTQAQNAALKVLEEPPRFVSFVLGTGASAELLSTVRSRCEVFLAGGESEAFSDELAEEYVALAAKGFLPELSGFFAKCESLENERISEMIAAARQLLSGIVSGSVGEMGLSRREAARLLELVIRAEEYLRLNVSVKHVLGMLCVLTPNMADTK